MPNIEEETRQGTPQRTLQGTPQEISTTEEANEGGILLLRIATLVVCIINLAYVVSTAVLIGMLKGWVYSIHCFILCLLMLLYIVRTIRSKTKLSLKDICWGSSSTLVLLLMTTFTLLTRQAFYHPSPHIEPKWVLFSLQLSIIPLIAGILVMYECSIKDLYDDRFILMLAVLDFADIWDMVSILSQDKALFLKEESPLEIAVQVFCSFSFGIFSVLIYKSITHESVILVSESRNQQLPSEEDKINPELVQKWFNSFCSGYAVLTSQLNQNIPFLVIRILLLVRYNFIEFDYLAKNVISVLLIFLDCCGCCQSENESHESHEN